MDEHGKAPGGYEAPSVIDLGALADATRGTSTTDEASIVDS